ncbi:hypothetical protein ABW21_db0200979 [Orbilia brochopaga]|nr:hypothetical protein ABW21_db0200979 [Drechslerella brochopaga]
MAEHTTAEMLGSIVGSLQSHFQALDREVQQAIEQIKTAGIELDQKEKNIKRIEQDEKTRETYRDMEDMICGRLLKLERQERELGEKEQEIGQREHEIRLKERSTDECLAEVSQMRIDFANVNESTTNADKHKLFTRYWRIAASKDPSFAITAPTGLPSQPDDAINTAQHPFPGPTSSCSGVEGEYVIVDNGTYIAEDICIFAADERHEALKECERLKSAIEDYKDKIKEKEAAALSARQEHHRTLEELKVEHRKVKTYKKKQQKQQELFELFGQTIDRIRTKNTKAKEAYQLQCEEEVSWIMNLLTAKAITNAQLADFPKHPEWPDIETALTRLSDVISQQVKRGQGSSPADGAASTTNNALPRSSTEIAEHKLGELDPITSDEEPESALAKFSPTSKAVMRQPGAETLAVLHPEIYQCSQDTKDAISQAVANEVATPIKREPFSQQADTYSRYGYNRLAIGGDESLDLDKVAGGVAAPGKPADGDECPTTSHTLQETNDHVTPQKVSSPANHSNDAANFAKAEPVSSPVRPRAPTGNRSPLGEIAEPNLRQPSEERAEEKYTEGHAVHTTSGKKLADLLANQTQDEKLPPSAIISDFTTDLTKLKEPSVGKGRLIYRGKMEMRGHSSPWGDLQLPKGATAPHPTTLRSTTTEKRPLDFGGTRKDSKRARTRPSRKGSDPFALTNYRINPEKNDGVDFAYTEVVRDKSKKACLPTCVKACCKDLISGKFEEMWQPPEAYKAPKFSAQDSSQPDAEEEELMQEHEDYRLWKNNAKKSEQALKYGKHKAQHQKAPELKGFWISEFPNTQQLEEQRAESERRYREKAFKVHDDAKRGGIYQRRCSG